MPNTWDKNLFKTCKECGKSFQLTEVYWKTPRSFLCLPCRKEAVKLSQKKYRDKKKKKRAEYIKKWRAANKERVLLYKKKWRYKNKDKIKEIRKKYYSKTENIDKKKRQDKEYYLNNKGKIRKYQRQWEEDKPIHLFKKRVSHAIRLQLKKNNASKSGCSAFKYLDYTLNDLKIYIEKLFEPWMNWNNYGTYIKDNWDDKDPNTWRWQLDHIIPQSNFPYDSMEHPNFKKCWALNNLRPLSAKQNVLDGDRRTDV